MSITKGRIQEPQKVVIYGPQGVGKTSLAALFPNPLFLDTERGTRRMNVDRVEIESLKHFNEEIAAIPSGKDYAEYQTVVVDTIDWLEAKVKELVVATYSMKDRSYGREESFIGDEILKLLNSFTPLLESGKHVVLLAHSATVKMELPDVAAAFDRYELDMGKKHVAPLVKHWADHLLFLKNKISVSQDEDGKNKGVGKGERILCTSTTAAYDAKIRVPDALSVGEFPVKSPEDGIAIIKGIFESVGAPWGASKPSEKPAAPSPNGARGNPATGTDPSPSETKGTAAATPAQKPVRRDQEPDADEIPGVNPEVAKLDELFKADVDAVNSFLIARREISEGQSYADVSPAYRSRVLKQPAEFLKAARAHGKPVPANA
jgi:GTPase SAR1 family protein